MLRVKPEMTLTRGISIRARRARFQFYHETIATDFAKTFRLLAQTYCESYYRGEIAEEIRMPPEQPEEMRAREPEPL